MLEDNLFIKIVLGVFIVFGFQGMYLFLKEKHEIRKGNKK
jgi:hypothetical protein